MMMETHAAIVFEIPVKKTASPESAAIKQRLEESANKYKSGVTLEKINQKLEHATQKRNEIIKEHIENNKKEAAKVELTKERRSSQERAQEEKTQEELGKKMMTAEQMRQKALIERQERLRSHHAKVSEMKKTIQEKKTQEIADMKHQLEEKLSKASALHESHIEHIKQTAVESAKRKPSPAAI